jgi:hypothetical protein
MEENGNEERGEVAGLADVETKGGRHDEEEEERSEEGGPVHYVDMEVEIGGYGLPGVVQSIEIGDSDVDEELLESNLGQTWSNPTNSDSESPSAEPTPSPCSTSTSLLSTSISSVS